MAPADETAAGFPQDSNCMTNATRLGSSPYAPAHLPMDEDQCCTSPVNTGEMASEPAAEIDSETWVGVGVTPTESVESPLKGALPSSQRQ